MKLTFESNLVYQQEAIQAAVNLFEGQMSEESGCQYSLNENGVLDLTAGIGNRLVLSKEQILANLQKCSNRIIFHVPLRLKICISRSKWKQVLEKHTFICAQSMS